MTEEHATKQRMSRWRARPWLWAALLVVVTLTALFYRPRRADGSLHVGWSFRQWRFGHYETRETVQMLLVDGRARQPPIDWFTLVKRGYRIGPLHVFTEKSILKPMPLGTNAPGSLLNYSRMTN